MSLEIDKLKAQILPKLPPDLSIELQKSIVQFELNNYKESLELISKTLVNFLQKFYYEKEFPLEEKNKSISEMLKDLKSRNIEIDREISTTLLRIEAKGIDSESADSIILESCIDGCTTIFEWHLSNLQNRIHAEKSSSNEVSKYVLEEIIEMYNEAYSKNSIQSNYTRVKSLLDKYPENKQIREIYFYLLSFVEKNLLISEAKAMVENKNYSIRLSSTIIILLAESKLIDESFYYLEFFENEYPEEAEIQYAKAFIFIINYINKNKQKDLDRAEAILKEIELKDDYFFNYIYSLYQIAKFRKNYKEYKALNNKGFFLEKLRILDRECEKNFEEQEQEENIYADHEESITQKVIEKAEQVRYNSEAKNKSDFHEKTKNRSNYYRMEFSLIHDSKGMYRGRFNWSAFFFTWIWGFTNGLIGISFFNLIVIFIMFGIGDAFNRGGSLNILYLITTLGWSIYWGNNGNYLCYNKFIYLNKINN
jgi:hypothetical protein